ncbi:MAG: hypothetical protein JXB07_13175 [Anaerolineae bacterium]|nr:hypothetical protein [Anaerolineae bacterium]
MSIYITRRRECTTLRLHCTSTITERRNHVFHRDGVYIGKIGPVGAVQVLGYSKRRIDRNLCDLADRTFAGLPTAIGAAWATLIEQHAWAVTQARFRPLLGTSTAPAYFLP